MVKFNQAPFRHCAGFSKIQTAIHRGILTALASSIFLPASVTAQVPPLLWRTNVNATLFAVDSQTNVYANANGTVVTLNSQGVPFKTNSYCPVPSIAPEFALRDLSGNFYFAGNFDGTNDFGGKIIVGGWTNATPTPGKWQPGYPTGFLAKYAPNGALVWATRIDGNTAGSNVVSDAVLNPDGSVTVGIYVGMNFAQIVLVSSTGSNLWQTASLNSQPACGPVKLTSLHGTNGGFLLYNLGTGVIAPGHYTSSGTKAFDSSKGVYFTPTTTPSGKPVTTPANELYMAGRGPFGQLPSLLQKAVIGGSVVWTQAVANVETWLLNGDNRGNLYVSGTDGSFYEYNSAGTQIWTNNYGSPGVFGVSDLIGNRLVQFADNTIAFLSANPGAVAPHVHLSGQAGDGLTSAGFQFSLAADAGSAYQVIYTTNFTLWQSMGYVSSSTSDIQVVDPDATNRPQKFYQLAP